MRATLTPCWSLPPTVDLSHYVAQVFGEREVDPRGVDRRRIGPGRRFDVWCQAVRLASRCGLALGLVLVASLGSIVGWVESTFAVQVFSRDVYPLDRLPTEARAGEIVQKTGRIGGHDVARRPEPVTARWAADLSRGLAVGRPAIRRVCSS